MVFLELVQFGTFLISTAYRFKLMKLEAGFWRLRGLFSELLHKRLKVTEEVVCQKGNFSWGFLCEPCRVPRGRVSGAARRVHPKCGLMK